MFERYTEKARRAIFFSRYEASQFGSPAIESEHLLLGLFREDKELTQSFLGEIEPAIQSICAQIGSGRPPRAKISTSVDLPLSHECKRYLAYAAEEAERLQHQHVGTPHLLLGLLREPGSLAAQLLTERGVRLNAARLHAAGSSSGAARVPAEGRFTHTQPPPTLLAFLVDRLKAGDVTVALDATVAGHPVNIALFEGSGVVHDGDPLTAPGESVSGSPSHEITRLPRKIRDLLQRIEEAIGMHDFEKAQALSDQERLSREELARLQSQSTEDPPKEPRPDPVPFLCILLLGNQSLSGLRIQLDRYLQAGVADIWLLDFAERRAYTAKAGEGLRELTVDTLRVEQPPVELDWGRMKG